MQILLLLKNKYVVTFLATLLACFVLWSTAQFYLNQAYNDGRLSGIKDENEVWLAFHNEETAKANKKIADTESHSRSIANDLIESIERSAKELDSLKLQVNKFKEKYNTSVYTKTGEVACTAAENQELYLGPEFSTVWNLVNDKALQHQHAGEENK